MIPKPAEWMDFALNDLRSGEGLFQINILDTSCFHAQQAAEKAMKGFLVDNNIPPPKSHNLVDLNRVCRKIDSGFSDLREMVTTLNQFYMPTRYPDAPAGTASGGVPSKDLARKALDFAHSIVAFCSKKIK